MTRSILSAALLLAATSAEGAVVTFTSTVISPTDASGSFLNTSGTLLDAISFGQARTSPYTYNSPGTASNPNPAPTLNGVTFVSTLGSTTLGDSYYSITQSGGTGALGYDTGRFSNVSYTNQSLFGLVYDVLRTGSNDGRMTLSLNNLIAGQAYQVQMIFSTDNTADSNTSPADRTVQIAAGAFTQGSTTQSGVGADGTSVVYSYGPTTGAIDVTATFTADNASEALNLLSNTTGGNSRVSLAGLVISEVPEASTSTLVVGALASLAFLRRRSS